MFTRENTSGIMLMPGEGKTLTLGGVRVSFKTASTDTGGKWSLVEYSAPPHYAGTPAHWHRQTAEAFYVLEGNPTFQLGDTVTKTEPGAFIYVPKGVVHTFANPGDQPARFLTFILPGGFEQYWVELADMMQTEPAWPPSDTRKVTALTERYDQLEPRTIR